MKLNFKKAIPLLATGLLVGSSFAFGISSIDQWRSFGADTAIVVGADALAIDTIAATDFNLALGGVGPSEPIYQGEVIKLERSGNKYNLHERFTNVRSSFDDAEMPFLLASGRYEESEGDNKNKVGYTQTLELKNNGELVFDQDDDLAKSAGVYLLLEGGKEVYEYRLEFEDPVEYNNESTADAIKDLVPTTIKFLGKTFTISDLKVESGKLEEITFQSGETSVWLMEATPIKWYSEGKEYTVELIDVTENEDSCGIKVNNEGPIWIDVGETKEVGGLNVGVIDAKAVHQQTQTNDACLVNLGALEFKIKNDDEIRINDIEVDGTYGIILETTGGEWEGFSFTWAPEDDIYLPTPDGKNEVVDPAFGNFKIQYTGYKANYEDIKVEVSGASGKIIWKKENGKEITLPFYCQGGCDDGADKVWFASKNVDEDNEGDIDSGEKIKYLVQVGGKTNYTNLTGGANIPRADVVGLRFLRVKTGDTYLYEITDIDLDEDKITVEEVSSGASKTTVYTPGTETDINLPYGLTVKMTIDDDNSTYLTRFVIDLSDNENPKTEFGAEIDLASYLNLTGNVGFEIASIADGILKVTEDEDYDGDDPYTSPAQITLSASIDPQDNEIDLNQPDITPNTYYGFVDESDTNDDNKHAMTYYGTRVIYDTENKKRVTIKHPDEELYGEVYLAEIGALISVPPTGGAVGNLIVSDTELTPDLKARNLIVVGGSAVNRVAADLLGLPYPTYGDEEGWQEATGVTGEGQAIVKLLDNPYTAGKQALLVAGWSGSDTRKAAKAVVEGLPGLVGKTSARLDTSAATAVVIE